MGALPIAALLLWNWQKHRMAECLLVVEGDEKGEELLLRSDKQSRRLAEPRSEGTSLEGID